MELHPGHGRAGSQVGDRLPAGLSDLISGDLFERFRRAVELVVEHPRARVISHYDADGVSAGGIVCKALLRKGRSFHATLRRSFERDFIDELKAEANDFIIICDMGSGQIDSLEELKTDIVVLDHHAPLRDSDSIVHINPHNHGLDGATQGSASTLSFLLALGLSESNWDLCGYAIAGAYSDRQHVPEFSGLNRTVLDEAVRSGLITVERRLAFNGDTLGEGLEKTIYPFFKEVSGRKNEISKMLKKLGLEPSLELRKLEGETKRHLASYLSLHLLKQGARPETVEELVQDSYLITSMDMYASYLASLMNACGRTGHLGTGLSLCLGDNAALEEGKRLREKYLAGMMEGLINLEKEGVFEKDHVQFFYVDNASYSGTWAGVGMQYLFNQEKPTIALSVQEQKTRISGRGTHYLVGKGLNLAEAFKSAAESLDGSGGGHAVASGATIPKGKEEKFLDAVDSIVEGQLKPQE